MITIRVITIISDASVLQLIFFYMFCGCSGSSSSTAALFGPRSSPLPRVYGGRLVDGVRRVSLRDHPLRSLAQVVAVDLLKHSARAFHVLKNSTVKQFVIIGTCSIIIE